MKDALLFLAILIGMILAVIGGINVGLQIVGWTQ